MVAAAPQIEPQIQSCLSRTQAVEWSGIAVARSSIFHAICIFVYILHLMYPVYVVAVYHCMVSGIANAIVGDENRRGQLSSGMKEAILDLQYNILQQRYTLEMPMAKLRSRWPESS